MSTCLRGLGALLLAAGWCAAPGRAQSDLFGYSVARLIPMGAHVGGGDFSADGAAMVVAGESGQLWRVDPADGTARQLARLPGRLSSVALSRDGEVALAWTSGGSTAWLLGRGSGWLELGQHRRKVTAAALAPDGKLAVTSGEDRALTAWDPASGAEVFRLESLASRPLRYLGFRRGGAAILGVSAGGDIIEWDVNNRRVLRQFQDSGGQVNSVAACGAILALETETTGLARGNPMRAAHPSDFYRANRIKIYDLNQGVAIKEIDGIEGELPAISFSPDCRFLAALRQQVKSAFVSIYDLQRGVETASVPAQDGSALARFSPDGRWLAAAAPDGRLAIYAVAGVQRSADPGDLAGVKIRITSADPRPLLAPGRHLVIAVMDLEGRQVDAATGTAVADMLRNRLVSASWLELVERERVQRVIQEQNFQNSSRADMATAVRLGRILNAKKLILGAVSRLGTTFTITAQVVDVETARIDGIREVLCQRCAVEDLPAAAAELAAALAGTGQ
ncbi:MAG TPA: CsgG/HfaB family protein [Bryobacteraceae bacterium]|nr:CsgG/HfaB family protein [Bryobacteraceae bacterium]